MPPQLWLRISIYVLAVAKPFLCGVGCVVKLMSLAG